MVEWRRYAMARSITAPRSASTTRASRTVAVVLGAVVLAAFVLMGVMLDPLPPKVAEITVVNPHPWAAQVEVGPEDAAGRLLLGSVPPESEATFLETTDQGDRWAVTFTYRGSAVERTVERSDLEGDDWTVTVPDELADVLAGAGTPETPAGSG
jgi:hypothetical protein